MKIAIYNIITGEILQYSWCPPEHAADQCKEGFTYYEDCPDDMTHIIDGIPTRVPPPPLSEAEIKINLKNDVIRLIQRTLDSAARSRNYDSIISLCSYSNSTDPIFAAEGQAGVAWRDACWRYASTALAEVEAGIRPIPTPEELIAELPTLGW